MKKVFFISLALLLISSLSYSKIRLPEIVGDNMVLQQSTKVRIWGWSGPNSAICITTSWNNKKYSTVSKTDSTWEITVSTTKADCMEKSLVISEYTSFNKAKVSDQKKISGILFGEVWFCSGQSNMQMPLKGFNNQPIENANRYILEAGEYPYVRVATIKNVKALTPQKEVPGKWMISNSENAPWFGGVAYIYAINLYKALKVPVGIINCSWGGSRVEGWLPEWKLSEYPDVDVKDAERADYKEYLRPMIMYNGMLKPLEKYTIKGFLWYQGESNVSSYKTYAQRLNDMVSLWREEWGLGNIPFYFVEIAPYNYKEGVDFGAYLREQQAMAQKIIPNSVMVSTGDILKPYENNCIHPSNKTIVAERLTLVALSDTYGFKGICFRSPEFDKIELKENESVLFFNNAEEGLTPFENIDGFEAAGVDKVFYPVKARADMRNKSICISSDKIDNIVAIRFCFHNLDTVKIHNTRGFPVIPFRTDNW